MKFTTIVAWAAGITAIAGVCAGAWATMDSIGIRPVLNRELSPLEEQIASNTKMLQLQRWQYLTAKRRNQPLSPQEMMEYCALSRALGFRVQGCA